MRYFQYLLFIVTAAALLVSCEEKEEEHPKIKSLPSSATSATSCLLKGEIINAGDFKVIDHGFIYSTVNAPSLEWGSKVSLGAEVKKGPFEKEVSDATLFDSWNNGSIVVYFRAYITNELGTAYGEPLQIDMPSLTVTGVAPLNAKEGDVITISGTNFSPTATDYEVYFNNTKGSISKIESAQIAVVVPGDIDYSYWSENIRVVLKLGGREVEVTNNFYVEPSATDFSPKTGSFGTYITISGSNFRSGVTVKVGEVQAYPISVETNAISFQIPSGVTTESPTITVLYNSKTTVLPGEFKILPPVISEISPLEGAAGQEIIVTGEYLKGRNAQVTIGGIQAYVYTSSSSESLRFYIPYDLEPGLYKIIIDTGVHTITSATDFKVIEN